MWRALQALLLLSLTTVTVPRSLGDAEKGCTAPYSLPNLPFFVVWDVPSGTCERRGLTLNLTAYGIVSNKNSVFDGDNITIFYNIGAWPYFHGPNHDAVNGGLPQTGDLHKHLQKETQVVKSMIRSSDYTGLAVIDFEAWRPYFGWNFDSLKIYQIKSDNLVKKQHPTWNGTAVRAEAIRQFDTAARAFMESTLQLAKQLRPFGYWGYYGYPRCWGVSVTNVCHPSTPGLNDKYLSWMFSQSTGLYPRIYTLRRTSLATRKHNVRQIVNETLRVQVKWSSLNTPIMPYTYVLDSATDLFTKDDLGVSIVEPADMGASGVTIWASSNIFHTKGECLKLKTYVREVLGPLVKNLTAVKQSCAQTLCNNHGRCVSKEYEAQTQEFLRLKQTKTCFRPREEYENLTSRRQTQFGELLYRSVSQYDYYICRCLAGWYGEFCDKKA